MLLILCVHCATCSVWCGFLWASTVVFVFSCSQHKYLKSTLIQLKLLNFFSIFLELGPQVGSECSAAGVEMRQCALPCQGAREAGAGHGGMEPGQWTFPRQGCSVLLWARQSSASFSLHCRSRGKIIGKLVVVDKDNQAKYCSANAVPTLCEGTSAWPQSF